MSNQAEVFKKFCMDSGFRLDENQIIVIDSIFKNIDKGNKIQTIIMPNSAGKTNLSILLGCFFKQHSKEPMIYSPLGTYIDIKQMSFLKNNEETLNSIKMYNSGTIVTERENVYDYIIADGLGYADMTNLIPKEVTQKFAYVIDNPSKAGEILTEADLEWAGSRFLSKITVRSNAFIIIFTTRRSMIACKKMLFFKSPKNVVVDVYNETITNKEINYAIDISNAIKSLKSHFDQKLNSISDKLDDIEIKINELCNIAKSIQNKVYNKKQAISAFASIADDEPGIEIFVEKSLNQLAKQLREEIVKYEKLSSYHQYEQLVQVRLGKETWNKLEIDSQRFLVTAKLTFSENVLFGDNVDYSSICLLASKAFEIELANRFVVEYERYIKEKYGNDLNKWPSALIKNDKYGKKQVLRKDEFMLGTCPYIMGLLPKNSTEASLNYKCFKLYCLEKLFDKTKCNDIDDMLKVFDNQIKTIKNKYRNPAAHKSSINLLEASECLDYILEVENVLKEMIDVFNF